MPRMDGEYSRATGSANVSLIGHSLTGFEACKAIRKVEDERYLTTLTDSAAAGLAPPPKWRSKIFALTGLAALEDKAKAFAAGVDG